MSDTLPPPESRARGRRTVMVRVAAVLAIVTLLAFAGVSVAGYGPLGRDRTTSAEAVAHYLGAIAEADADAALALLAAPPLQQPLLTDQVLAESRARAPISGIRVVQLSREQVEASYLLGTQQVTALFDTIRQPNGTYRLRRGTSTVRVTLPKNLPTLVNGTPITASAVEAFPGDYELTTGLPHVQYAEPDFTVSGPDAAPQLVPTAELNAPGQSAFLRAARARLTECLTSKELNPRDCPQQVALQPDQRPDAATIEWTLEGDPFARAQPRLAVTDQTVAELRIEVRMHLQARGTQAGQPGLVDTSLTFATTATALVTEEPMIVRFVND